MREYETYRCNKCGNEVEVCKVGGGVLICCGDDMECITDNLTSVNLLKSFAGESQARNKYEYYAKIAQKEGYRDIAAHFQRASNNEKEHAKLELMLFNIQKNGEAFGDTVANLADAISGESYENTTMYPNFAKIAKDEGNEKAEQLFTNIGKVEVEHEKMYKKLLTRLEMGYEFESENESQEWICEVCGHIHRGKKAPKTCPVCKHPQEYQSRFSEIK